MSQNELGRVAEGEQALVNQAATHLGPTGFDPSRITEAVELIEPNVLEPLVRKAADDFYGHVMEAAQDYLRDNMDFNLKAHLAMLERENSEFRRQLYEVSQLLGTPWATHAERIERLREMDRAAAELSALRYKLAFNPASAIEARRAATLGAVHESAGLQGDAQTPGSSS